MTGPALARARAKLVSDAATRYRAAVAQGRTPTWARLAAAAYLRAAELSRAMDRRPARSTGRSPARAAIAAPGAEVGVPVTGLQLGVTTLGVTWSAAAGGRLAFARDDARDDARGGAAGEIAAVEIAAVEIAAVEIAAAEIAAAGDTARATLDLARLAARGAGRWLAEVDGQPLGVEAAAGLRLGSAPRAETRVRANGVWRTVAVGWTDTGQLAVEVDQ